MIQSSLLRFSDGEPHGDRGLSIVTSRGRHKFRECKNCPHAVIFDEGEWRHCYKDGYTNGFFECKCKDPVPGRRLKKPKEEYWDPSKDNPSQDERREEMERKLAKPIDDIRENPPRHQEEITLKKPKKGRKSSTKGNAAVKSSSEESNAPRDQETARKELGKLKKLRDQYLETAKTSINPREIIFAVKFAESLRPQIERMEREVSE